ncbi:MAG: patatin-like phospholipase family protein [Rhodothermales bacterium]
MGLTDVVRRVTRAFNPLEPVNMGLLLSGGGARASYQAGVLKYLGEAFPTMRFPILTGVSAGAINAAHLGTHSGDLKECTERLVDSWLEISPGDVYQSESSISWAKNYLFKRSRDEPDITRRAFLETSPLRDYLMRKLSDGTGRLAGVETRLASGFLQALAIVTTNYTTGQTVTWVQGSDIERWERPNRVSFNTSLTIDHVMASTALPLIFPAIQIGDAYYGDGGIRLAAPLAPAVHLGANKVLAISTRYARSRAEADEPQFVGYPPLGQIFGLLMNSIFLDALDQDALMMDRINALLDELPRRKRLGLRPVELLVLRPSVDLGRLASEFETTVTGPLALFSRLFGRSKSPDWLSMLLFENQYVTRLIEVGYTDAREQHDRIEGFLEDSELPPRSEAHLAELDGPGHNS